MSSHSPLAPAARRLPRQFERVALLARDLVAAWRAHARRRRDLADLQAMGPGELKDLALGRGDVARIVGAGPFER